MKKTLCILLASLLIVPSLASCNNNENTVGDGTSVVAQAMKIDSKVLGTYDDYEIYLNLYKYLYYTSKYSNEQNAIQNGYYSEEEISQYWDMESSTGEKYIDLLHAQTMKEAKQYTILYKLATDANITQPSTGVDSYLQNWVGYFGEEKKLEEYFGMTIKQFTQMLNLNAIVVDYTNNVSDYVEVSEDQIKEIYDKNADNYDQVVVRHVLINCDDSMTQEEQDAAKTKAEDILKQIQDGADIGVLAKEHSEDPGSKDNNGEYTFGKGKMVKEFEDWAFNAKSDDVGIVKTSYGYHVMKLINRLGYEDIKDTLASQASLIQIESIVTEAQEAEWKINDKMLEEIK